MEDKKKGYGNSYFTSKNILIYIVLAAIVYGAIYFLYIKKGNNTNPYSAPVTKESPTPQAMSSMTVALGAQNGSGESGTATLSEADGKTTVVVTVSGSPANVEQPAHIHTGACPKPGDVVYPLKNLVNGTSTTVLDVTLDKLKSSLPLAVNVHKSKTEVSVYTACGDLK